MRLTTQRLKQVSFYATMHAVNLDEDDAWCSKDEQRKTWEAIEALDHMIAQRKKARQRKPRS